MSLIKRNPLMNGVSGMLGGTVVFRTTNGQQQMISRPKKRAKISDKQQLTVDRFKEATAYANAQRAFPEVMKEYATGINPKSPSAYHVAHNDYLNAPVVDYIKTDLYTGTPGDMITIKARDNFKVVRVSVEIINKKGKVLEQGEAERSKRKKFIWKYKATVANKYLKETAIRATAFDRPGNVGILEVSGFKPA